MLVDELPPYCFDHVCHDKAATLTKNQIDAYNRDGFVQPFNIFGRAEIGTIRGYIDGLIRAKGEDGHYGINCYQARLSTLWDIATNSLILDHVQDIIGSDILCWASAILSKKPHDHKAVPWHQDAAFWHLAPSRTVTVWLAIDDVDEHNAAMQFIPGSHNVGLLQTQNGSATDVFHKQTASVDNMGQPVSNALKAGQISLHADMLVHGSLANTSNRRRCGLTLRYCPPSVHITDEVWANGVEAILCRGSAPDWHTHVRPDNDDINNTSCPHVVGNN